MDGAALEARIAELEAEIEVARREMELFCREFLEATGRLVAGWFPEHVERIVLGKPDVTKTLSHDALRSLKAELRKLTERAPELVRAHLNRDQYWAHRQPVLNDSSTMLNLELNPYDYRPGRPPEALNGAIRDVLAVADGLLERYGFGLPSQPTEPPSSRRGRRLTFEWTDEMKATLAAYAARYGRLKQLNSEVLPLRRRRGESEARRLWDQA